ncbi:MAG: prolipoprotein diacylglyceryl transferase [bacterium]|nr:prolipoprotein diacylglyceryl transferase [bacterium]
MVYFLLKGTLKFSILGPILNVIYYGLIFSGMALSCLFIYRRLLALEYETVKVRIFIILGLVCIFPIAIASSEMVNMFYFPPDQWSFGFFVKQFVKGTFRTFHGGIFLPVLFVAILIRAMKFKYAEVFDASFLYIPFAHAIGRLGCFLVGCCWGAKICIPFLGNDYYLKTPIPLFSIGINLLLFLFLRKVYNRIYSTPDGPAPNRNIYASSIVGLYFLCYGMIRFLLELVRTEKVVYWIFTQAQAVMLIFIFLGSLLLLRVYRKHKRQSLPDEEKDDISLL